MYECRGQMKSVSWRSRYTRDTAENQTIYILFSSTNSYTISLPLEYSYFNSPPAGSAWFLYTFQTETSLEAVYTVLSSTWPFPRGCSPISSVGPPPPCSCVHRTRYHNDGDVSRVFLSHRKPVSSRDLSQLMAGKGKGGRSIRELFWILGSTSVCRFRLGWL